MAKFKTRARTVDLLGRQQIADNATAISELFKNAHDAYADHVEVDYFGTDKLLVIRDDGIGMTQEEFENRWLVLGTESKLDSSSHNTEFKPKNKKHREIMGEKGIGRLAIALLGSQVLVLTKAKRGLGGNDLSMCFIHWGLFEVPSLNLEDIDFPIVAIPDGRLPNDKDVRLLLDKNKNLVHQLQLKHANTGLGKIIRDIDSFQADPEDLDVFMGGLSLKGNQTGTHFIIAPANEEIASEIEREKQSKNKDFTKSLLGFCNSVFCSETGPQITTALRYWETDLSYEELIGPGEFFTKEEVLGGDQHFVGEFNEYGQFTGTVRVYEKEYKDHVISWNNGGGRTLCGPFNIEFSYLQGNRSASIADAEDFSKISSKLDSFGGLYVYRDGIRVLPYGNSDIDWLDIELRRNKGMGHYFFSYRRIYGAVCLTKSDNSSLHEKAGREGFQKDKAYRQLKDILENFFVQLAADFFRSTADYGDYFRERKTELDRLANAKKQREKQTGAKKRVFTKELELCFQRISEEEPEKKVEQLRSSVLKKLEAVSVISNLDHVAKELIEAENQASRTLREIRSDYQVSKPKGVGLNRKLESDWMAYKKDQERLETKLFTPLSKEIAEVLGAAASEARLVIDQRSRLRDLIGQVASTFEVEVKSEAHKVEEASLNVGSEVTKVARNAISDFGLTVKQVEAKFAEYDFSSMSFEDAEAVRETCQFMIEESGRKNSELLSSLRETLTSTYDNFVSLADTNIGHLDVLEAMDSELQVLREQSDTDAELVQLGLAIAIINHEFEAAIKSIRRNLRDLGAWAKANEEMMPLYREIRTNFDHLDAHLNLFTPLQRRLHRNRVTVKGSDINHYVRTLFKVRFMRHEVNLDVSQAFLDSEISGFPSTIYPVFVNIVDNAIFWLKEIQGKRFIRFNFVGDSYFIGNNGPAIPDRDYETIFEQGFTRKPGGRGLGLYISKKALRKDGMDLFVSKSSDAPPETLFEISCPEMRND